MQLPVLIERLNGCGFKARTGAPLDLAAEGATRDEALDNLRAKIAGAAGTGELVTVDVPDSNPWLRLDGIFRDDPTFDDWVRAMEENRRRIDADPNQP